MSDLTGTLLLVGLGLSAAVFLVLIAFQLKQSRKRTQATLERLQNLAPRVDLQEAMRRVDVWERGEARQNVPSAPLFSRRPARPA